MLACPAYIKQNLSLGSLLGTYARYGYGIIENVAKNMPAEGEIFEILSLFEGFIAQFSV